MLEERWNLMVRRLDIIGKIGNNRPEKRDLTCSRREMRIHSTMIVFSMEKRADGLFDLQS